ncbi:MAG: hypothetical protein AAFU66_06680 [Pseudomonadota bacterium]
MPQDNFPPSTLSDLARQCTASVQREVGVQLDGLPETLPILDHYVSVVAPEVGARADTLLVALTGAYFGQVACDAIDGLTWRAAGEIQRWCIAHRDIEFSFNPAGIALEVTSRQDAAGWNAHLAVATEDQDRAASSLQLLGPASKRDYYSFTVRFECIEQVLGRLGSNPDRPAYS